MKWRGFLDSPTRFCWFFTCGAVSRSELVPSLAASNLAIELGGRWPRPISSNKLSMVSNLQAASAVSICSLDNESRLSVYSARDWPSIRAPNSTDWLWR